MDNRIIDMNAVDQEKLSIVADGITNILEEYDFNTWEAIAVLEAVKFRCLSCAEQNCD